MRKEPQSNVSKNPPTTNPATEKKHFISIMMDARSKGHLHKATSEYVQVRSWSPKRYYHAMSPKRVKDITSLVAKRVREKTASNQAKTAKKRSAETDLTQALLESKLELETEGLESTYEPYI